MKKSSNRSKRHRREATTLRFSRFSTDYAAHFGRHGYQWICGEDALYFLGLSKKDLKLNGVSPILAYIDGQKRWLPDIAGLTSKPLAKSDEPAS